MINSILQNKLDGIFSQKQLTKNNLESYVKGKNIKILSNPVSADPDNRIPVPFGRKILSTLKGYIAKPGYITYSTNNIDTQTTLKDIFDSNDEELLTGELLADALLFGESYEILAIDMELGIKQYKIDWANGYPIYSKDLEKKLEKFVYRISYEDIETDQTIEVQTIYYPNFYETYKRVNSGGWILEETKAHPFDDVPVIVYHVSDIQQSILTPILPLVDEHDKIISSAYADERERFANSYLIMLRNISTIAGDDGLSDADKIKKLRMFTNLGEDGEINNVHQAIGFLTKPSRGSETSESADRFERLIYEMAMVINTYDDDFGTASGIALMYKILGMEWFAADIEGYFSKGLQRRVELIFNALDELTDIKEESFTINFRRNLPFDLGTLADIVIKLKGIISDKTLLSLFPANIIPSVEEELEAMESSYDLDSVVDSTDNDTNNNTINSNNNSNNFENEEEV